MAARAPSFPDLFAGCLDFSFLRLIYEQDAAALVEHVRTFSHNSQAHTAPHVRAVDMGHCNLSTLSDDLYQRLLDYLSRFTNLERLRVNNCALSHTRVVSLMIVIKSLPNFQRPREHTPLVPNGHKSLIFSELAIGGNEIDDHTLHAIYTAMDSPMLGIGILSLMDCSITNVYVVDVLCRLFPSVAKLFLCNTKVDGSTMEDAVGLLCRLRVLGMDRTPTSGDGAKSIYKAMVKRTIGKSTTVPSNMPLEVWLRGVTPGPDSAWEELLNFSSNGKNSVNFILKHDRRVAVGNRLRHTAKVYETLTVKLCISGFSPFEIPYERVVCTKAIFNIAKEAINELNMISMDDQTHVKDNMIKKRRELYRRVVGDFLFGLGRLNKQYEVGFVQLTCTNKFTGDKSMSYDVGSALLPVPRADTDYVLEVEAVEAEGFSYNNDGARIVSKG
tara:strand:- start:4848 stop:6176 length:1329 start_codon:yes stop_codon:yes gene_type:complete